MTGEILFIAHRTPYPPDRGDKIRSWNSLRGISQLATVHVAALLDPDDPRDGLDELRAVSKSLTLVPCRKSKLTGMARGLLTGKPASVAALHSRAFQQVVDKLVAAHPIRAIYAHSGQMAQFVRSGAGQPRFVMDFVDMDSAKFMTFAEQGEGPMAWANRQEGRRLFAWEKAVARRSDVSLFVSEAEAALFRAKSGLDAAKVRAMDNGIDLDRFHPGYAPGGFPEGEGPLIVFTGQMDYRPNVDAVVAFARETLPLIRAHSRAARFAIVGRAPTHEVLSLAELPGVVVTGAVADTRDWLAAADVVVAPLKLARGIQNKVLEAMAMARPVIASSPAAEGIDARAGVELLVADGARDEAAAALSLLANPDQAKALGRAGRARMEARYSWDSRLADLPEYLGLA